MTRTPQVNQVLEGRAEWIARAATLGAGNTLLEDEVRPPRQFVEAQQEVVRLQSVETEKLARMQNDLQAKAAFAYTRSFPLNVLGSSPFDYMIIPS